MATTITRTAMTDDSGAGIDGTIINNAWKTELYSQIDALFAGAFSLVGPLTVTAFGTHSFSAGGTGGNSLGIRNTTAGVGNYASLNLGNDASANAGQIVAYSTTYGAPYSDSVLFYTGRAGGIEIQAGHASGTIRFASGGGAERARFDTAGNFHMGGTAARATTVGTKAIQLFDGTAPVGTLANGVSLYSVAGKLWAMSAAGVATQLTP